MSRLPIPEKGEKGEKARELLRETELSRQISSLQTDLEASQVALKISQSETQTALDQSAKLTGLNSDLKSQLDRVEAAQMETKFQLAEMREMTANLDRHQDRFMATLSEKGITLDLDIDSFDFGPSTSDSYFSSGARYILALEKALMESLDSLKSSHEEMISGPFSQEMTDSEPLTQMNRDQDNDVDWASEMSKLSMQIKDLESRLLLEELESQSLVQQNEALCQQVTEKELVIDTVSQSLANVQTDLETRTEQNALSLQSLEFTNTQLRLASQNSQKALDQKIQDMNEVVASRDQSLLALQQIQTTLADLRRSNEETVALLNAKTQELLRSTATKNQIASELEFFKNQTSLKHKELEALKVDRPCIQDLASKISSLNQELEESTVQTRILDETRAALATERDGLKSRLQDLEARQSLDELEMQSLLDRNQELQGSIDHLVASRSSDVEMWESKFSECEVTRERLQDQLAVQHTTHLEEFDREHQLFEESQDNVRSLQRQVEEALSKVDSVQYQLEEFQSQAGSLQRQLEVSESKVVSVQHQLEESQSKVDSLQEQLEEAKKESGLVYQKTHDTFENERDLFMEDIKNKTDELERVTELYEQLLSEKEGVEAMFTKGMEALEALRSESELMRVDHGQLTEAHIQLTQQLEQSLVETDTVRAALNQSQRQCSQVISERDVLLEKSLDQADGLASQNTLIEGLRGQVGHLKSGLESLEEMTKQVQNLDKSNELMGLRSQLEEKTNEADNLALTLEELQNEMARLVDVSNELRSKKEDQDVLLSGVRSEFASLVDASNELRSQRDALEVDLKSSIDALEELRDLASESEKERMALLSQLETSSVAFTTLAQERDGLKNALEVSQEQVASLTVEISQLNVDKDAEYSELVIKHTLDEQDLATTLDQLRQDLANESLKYSTLEEKMSNLIELAISVNDWSRHLMSDAKTVPFWKKPIDLDNVCEYLDSYLRFQGPYTIELLARFLASKESLEKMQGRIDLQEVKNSELMERIALQDEAMDLATTTAEQHIEDREKALSKERSNYAVLEEKYVTLLEQEKQTLTRLQTLRERNNGWDKELNGVVVEKTRIEQTLNALESKVAHDLEYLRTIFTAHFETMEEAIEYIQGHVQSHDSGLRIVEQALTRILNGDGDQHEVITHDDLADLLAQVDIAYSTLRSQIQTHENTIAGFEVALVQAKSIIDDHELVISNLEAKRDELLEMNERTVKDLELKMAKAVEEMRESATTFMAKSNAVSAEATEASAREIQELVEKMEELKRTHVDDMNILRVSLVSAQENESEARSRLEELDSKTTENIQVQTDFGIVEEHEQFRADAESQLMDMEDKVADLTHMIELKNVEISNFEKRVLKLQAARRESVDGTVRILQRELEDAQGQVETLQSEKQSLLSELECRSGTQDVKKLEAKLALYDFQVQSLVDEKQRLLQSIDESQGLLNEARQDLQVALENKERVEKMYDSLNSDYLKSVGRRNLLESQIKGLEKPIVRSSSHSMAKPVSKLERYKSLPLQPAGRSSSFNLDTIPLKRHAMDSIGRIPKKPTVESNVQEDPEIKENCKQQ